MKALSNLSCEFIEVIMNMIVNRDLKSYKFLSSVVRKIQTIHSIHIFLFVYYPVERDANKLEIMRANKSTETLQYLTW